MRPTVDHFSEALWSNSLHASALIACILLIRLLVGRRLPAQCFVLLWVLAAVRLLTPFVPQSPWSAFNLLTSEKSAAPAEFAEWKVRVGPASPEQPAPHPVQKLTTAPAASPTLRLRWRDGLAAFWAAGVCTQVLLLAGSTWKIRRHLRSARCVQDCRTLALAKEAARQIGLAAPPAIYETDRVKGPAVLGLWRARLLLPPGLKDELTDDQLRHLLLHEFAHVRRHDLLALWLVLSARVVHWFNPLVWLAWRLARVDLELACDGTVLRKIENRVAYGETLLKLAQFARPQHSMVPAMGVAHRGRSIRERVARIGRYTPRGFLRTSLPTLCVVGAVAISFGADPASTAESQEPEPTSSVASGEQPPPAWADGWKVAQLTIPASGKIADAHVTLTSPQGRTFKLTPDVTSREGVSIGEIRWARSLMLRAQVRLRKGTESTWLVASAEAVSQDAALPMDRVQLEISFAFYELSEEAARVIKQLPSRGGPVRLEPGADPAVHAAVVDPKLLEPAVRELARLGAPRVSMKPGQQATIEMTRELRYPSAFAPNPDSDGPRWVPSKFETRQTGTFLTCEGTLDEDDSIHLKVTPELVKLLGYVDAESRKILSGLPDLPKTLPTHDALEWLSNDVKKALNPREVPPGSLPPVEEEIDDQAYHAKGDERPEPVFSSRKVNALTTLRSGESLVLLGLPEAEKIEPFTPMKGGKLLMAVITPRTINPFERER